MVTQDGAAQGKVERLVRHQALSEIRLALLPTRSHRDAGHARSLRFTMVNFRCAACRKAPKLIRRYPADHPLVVPKRLALDSIRFLFPPLLSLGTASR